jgi:hypothetical protein
VKRISNGQSAGTCDRVSGDVTMKEIVHRFRLRIRSTDNRTNGNCADRKGSSRDIRN